MDPDTSALQSVIALQYNPDSLNRIDALRLRGPAVETIKSAGRSVPVALVMLKARVDKPEAVRRLAKSDGNVRLAIEDNVLEL